MTAFATFRLAAWRELHTRLPVLLLIPALLLWSMVLKPEVETALRLFVVYMLLPPMAVYLAARPGAAADAFWRGLGGPSWARVLGATSVHVVFLAAIMAASVPSEMAWGDVFGTEFGRHVTVGTFVLLGLLYLSTAAARSVSAGPAVLAGPLAAGCLLVTGGWLNSLVWTWTPFLTSTLRLLLVVAALLGGWAFAARRFGAWGGAVKRRPLGAPLAAAAGIVLVPVGLDAADVGSLGLGRLDVQEVSRDGSRAAYAAPYHLPWFFEVGRTALWTEGEGHKAIGPVGGHRIRLGPEGSVAVWRVPRSDSDPQGPWVWFRDADGREARCDGMSATDTFRPDGSALFVRRARGVTTGPSKALLTAEGCEPLGENVRHVRWLGDERVELQRTRVRIGDRFVALPEVPDAVRPTVVGNELVLWSRAGGAHRLVADAFQPLATHPDAKWFRVHDGWFCTTRRLDGICHHLAASHDGVIPHARFEDLPHLHRKTWKNDVLKDPATGGSWLVKPPAWEAPPRDTWGGHLVWQSAVRGDRLRTFEQRGVREILPDGSTVVLDRF